MLNKILTTPVDNLVEIVKVNPNCSTKFLQERMNIPLEILEKWLVILEEYKVLKVNYRGFEGYVRYVENEDDRKKEQQKAKDIDVNKLKQIFMQKAQAKNLTQEEIKNSWPKFVTVYQKDIKELFYAMAEKKGFDSYKIADAWQKYNEELLKW